MNVWKNRWWLREGWSCFCRWFFNIGDVSRAAGPKELAYYSRVGSLRTKSKTKLHVYLHLRHNYCSNPVTLDDFEMGKEGIDGCKSIDGENEDENLFSEDDSYL